MVGDEVRVVYRKYDGALHWHQTMRRLGADRHGVWLGAPAGATSRRGDEPPVVFEAHQTMLVPREGWWTAVFNGPPATMEIYCDITTPPRWPHPGEVTMVDLDLDVCRLRPYRRVKLLDEDEFAEHQTRYSYPRDVVARATEAAAWLYDALGNGTEPFAGEYEHWLDQVATAQPRASGASVKSSAQHWDL